MLFSERNKHKPIRNIIQKESMDESLRNGLWNIFDTCIWKKYNTKSHWSPSVESSNLFQLISLYWHHFFKQTLDSIPDAFSFCEKEIKAQFFLFEWHEVYSFIEFTLINFPKSLDKKAFINLCNDVLERDNSAYRIINDQIVEITSEQEIQSIEEAMQATDKYNSVQQHLQAALKLMSDRQSPDYRNSIKESISAVESICKTVTNDDKATLGKALRLIDEKFGLHSALKESLSKLYGYTSDADGIRHAMMEESTLTFIDAKFMLVACTNFINYLLVKVEASSKS